MSEIKIFSKQGCPFSCIRFASLISALDVHGYPAKVGKLNGESSTGLGLCPRWVRQFDVVRDAREHLLVREKHRREVDGDGDPRARRDQIAATDVRRIQPGISGAS